MIKYPIKAYSAAFVLALIAGCSTLNYQKIPKQERKRYFELAAVSSQVTADEYTAITDSAEREIFWHKFWKEKDPTPTTQRNERYEEHQRRVAYADTFFNKLVHFWDDRGKIYIKYGEPDYRESNPMGNDLYDSDPFESTDDSNGEIVTMRKKSGTLGWEKWTYNSLARAFSFVQRDVGYSLVKDLENAKSGSARATLKSLQAIDASMSTLVDTLPFDKYEYDYGQPLDFPFDLARFAAKEKAEVWISYSIPLGEIVYEEATGRGLLNRSIVIFDENMAEVGRDEEMLTPIPPADQIKTGEGQAIDLVKFDLLPGEYSMAISAMDLNSGKTGIYKYKFSIIDYKTGAEETSDLVLSSDIRHDSTDGKFSKGGYRIIPQPGSSFKKGRDIYFYYELYNLKHSQNEPKILQIRHLIFSKKGNSPMSSPQELIKANSETVALAGGISTADIAAGDYILLVEIRDQNNGRIKNAAKSFKIYK